MVVEKKYENGLTLLYEQLPLKSCCFTLFVRSGSKFEDESNYGVAHFLEHTLFKGTKNRTEFEIAKDLEEKGIGSNAVTSKNYTQYYFACVAEQFEPAVEILSDMFFNSIYDKKAHETERTVIIEEYNSKMDKASSKVSINFAKIFFADSCMEVPTLGTLESIKNLKTEDLIDFYNNHYTADNIVLSFSGGLPLIKVEEVLNKYFISNFTSKKCNKIVPNYNFVNNKYIFESKDINQTIMEIGYKLDIHNLQEYRMIYLFNVIFGSGMNCRLFERLRNQLGLCYSIYGERYRINDIDSCYIINIVANQNDELLALKEIESEVQKICKDGINEGEFEKAKNIAIKNIVFGSEDLLYRAIDNVRQYDFLGRVTPYEEDIEFLKSLKFEEFNEFCKNMLRTENKCLSIISRNESQEIKDYLLNNK